MSNVRNLAMISPKATGKTSLVEAILFNAKVTNRLGKVDDGNTTSDFDNEEIERKMSLLTSICSFEYKNNRIHLVDTAGYSDFFNEVKLIASVIDNGVMVISGSEGVKSQHGKPWQVMDDNNLPRMIFINEMDKDLADFERTWETLKSTFSSAVFVPITVPVKKGNALEGVIDVIAKKYCAYKNDGSGSFQVGDIPEDLADALETNRERLVEAVAETDDELMERYLEGGEISAEEVSTNLKKAAASGKIIPVFAGSAVQNVGVTQFLDYFIQYSADPEEREDFKGKDGDGNEVTRKRKAQEKFTGTVIKTVVDQYAGKTSIFRVLSGSIKAEATIEIAEIGRKAKASGLAFVCGKNQKAVDKAEPGDIVCLVKADELKTGNTICGVGETFVLDRFQIPEPVIALAVTPKERGEEDKLSRGLASVLEEDPLLKTRRDEQTKQLTLCGMGQVHLDTVVKRLKGRFQVDVVVSPPEIPYRETISKPAKYVEYTHKKQSGGSGQYARVFIDMEPNERGGGYEFIDKIFGGVIDQQYRPSVDKGIQARMAEGILAGCPVTDIKISLVDGKTHPVDSKDIAFQVAGREVFKKAFDMCAPILLEPVMDVEVEVPDECMGDVIGDVNSRRGRVANTTQANNATVIKAKVPLAEMLRYAPELDAMTSGRGTYSMELSHYEEVPKRVADDIVAKYHRSKEESEK